MRRSLRVSLAVVVAMAVLGLGGTVAAGWSPQLGLDLQGGAAVTLRPNRPVSQGILDQSIEIIRNRVDALGVAEPDISRQGSAIIVQLPGVKDQQRALDVVGQTAELRFRPVLNVLPPEGEETTTTTTTPATSTTAEGATTTTAAPTTTTAGPTTTTAGPTTTTVPTTTTTVPKGTTPRDEDDPDAQVVLPEIDDGDVEARYVLGPAEATGKIVKTARAAVEPTTGVWRVDFEMTGSGAKRFDELAAKYFGQRIAIVLDGVVKSAPTINAQQFGGEGQITGDFSEREAKDLALVLRFGALPVQLEPQTVQTVSATLGKDSLKAGVAAGLVGLGLVFLYMILYYRALGIVVLLGLAVSGALMWSLVAFLGEKQGLALTLAGATGIIVSVGVTVDSYVVYFERLKDEIRSGKTVRSSVERGFARAYRTIVAADVSSLIGAALLYWLTVGSVRGFALFLGLSALLDLFVAYFFTRPMVAMLGRNRVFTEARWLGVARGLAAGTAGGT